jgi:hypothetical protein
MGSFGQLARGDVAIPAVEERALGVDLDGDGLLATGGQRSVRGSLRQRG